MNIFVVVEKLESLRILATIFTLFKKRHKILKDATSSSIGRSSDFVLGQAAVCRETASLWRGDATVSGGGASIAVFLGSGPRCANPDVRPLQQNGSAGASPSLANASGYENSGSGARWASPERNYRITIIAY
jgi:hypothetical protein